jgi:hypothetical protein
MEEFGGDRSKYGFLLILGQKVCTTMAPQAVFNHIRVID